MRGLLLAARTRRRVFVRGHRVVAPHRHRSTVGWCLLAGAIFAAPLDAASYQLTNSPSHAQILDVRVSPDGRYAVYLSDVDADGHNELWSVPIQGGPERRLSSPITSSSYYVSLFFAITPDSSRVVFRAAQETAGVPELYVSPIYPAQTSWTRLSNASAYPMTSFALAPGSDTVDFVERVSAFEGEAIWRISLTPGAVPHRIFPFAPTPLGTVVNFFRATPDGAWLLAIITYSGSQPSIFRCATAAPDSARLNPVAGKHVDVPSAFQLSPDSQWVSFAMTDNDQPANDGDEVYVAPVDGGDGSAVRVSGPTHALADIYTHRFSPDSARLMYVMDQIADGRRELFSAPAGGSEGSAIRISADTAAPGIYTIGMAETWNLGWVIFTATLYDPAQTLLCRAGAVGPPVASGPVFWSSTMPGSVDPFSFSIAPDGRRVIFAGDILVADRRELFTIRLDVIPDSPVRLSPEIPLSTWDVLGPGEFSPGGAASTFFRLRWTPLFGSTTEALWVVPTDGTAPARRISGSLGEHTSYSYVPLDQMRAVYLGQVPGQTKENLYVGDPCIFCDGFEGLMRWSSLTP